MSNIKIPFSTVRGTLGLLPTAFGNIGILICFIVGKYVGWSGLAFLGSTLPSKFHKKINQYFERKKKEK
jgi:hypothetical protein